jgi:hypothetical protein
MQDIGIVLENILSEMAEEYQSDNMEESRVPEVRHL